MSIANLQRYIEDHMTYIDMDATLAGLMHLLFDQLADEVNERGYARQREFLAARGWTPEQMTQLVAAEEAAPGAIDLAIQSEADALCYALDDLRLQAKLELLTRAIEPEDLLQHIRGIVRRQQVDQDDGLTAWHGRGGVRRLGIKDGVIPDELQGELPGRWSKKNKRKEKKHRRSHLTRW